MAPEDCMMLTHNDANWIMVTNGLSQNKMINILGEIQSILEEKKIKAALVNLNLGALS